MRLIIIILYQKIIENKHKNAQMYVFYDNSHMVNKGIIENH